MPRNVEPRNGELKHHLLLQIDQHLFSHFLTPNNGDHYKRRKQTKKIQAQERVN